MSKDRDKSVFLVEVLATFKVDAVTAEGAIRILKKSLEDEVEVVSVRLEHPAFAITHKYECSRCLFTKERQSTPVGQAAPEVKS